MAKTKRIIDGVDVPLNVWTAEYKDDGEIIIKEVPSFLQKENLKAYLDKLRIIYKEP